MRRSSSVKGSKAHAKVVCVDFRCRRHWLKLPDKGGQNQYACNSIGAHSLIQNESLLFIGLSVTPAKAVQSLTEKFGFPLARE